MLCGQQDEALLHHATWLKLATQCRSDVTQPSCVVLCNTPLPFRLYLVVCERVCVVCEIAN